MKNKIVKVMALVSASVLAMGTLAACGSETTNGQAQTGKESGVTEEASDVQSGTVQTDSAEASTGEQSDSVELSGTIQMVGSTSMEKLAKAMAESFMMEYPDVTVNAEFVGSSAGVEAVLGGTADIGNSSRNLKDSELQAGAVENIVAIDGIAVCLDTANTVTDLTKEQLIDIYTGEIKNWSELGGADAPVIVIGREAGSGTRGAFEELLDIEDACAYSNELDSTGAVIAKVASTPGAIGYASLDAIDDTVIAASLEGVEATAENIKAGDYFLCRPFVMATKGEIEAQNELVKAWFEYVFSEAGQEVAAAVGLITVE